MREMKDSGVEWIGEIPKDWDTIQIKKLLAARDGGSWGEEPHDDHFDKICYRVADFDFSRLAIVSDADFTVRNYTQPIIDKLSLERGDILVEKSGGGEKTPVGRAVFYDKDEPALFANFIERLRVSSETSPRYFFYVWIALYLTGFTNNYIKQTTGIQNLDIKSLVSSVFIPSFDYKLQHRIADYLDAKCAQIDRAIARQQEVIEKLKEYKLSVITEAVTKGLNPDAPMKDSGIAWIGEIPEHWSLPSIKRIAQLASGGTPDRSYPELWNGDIPWIKTGELRNDLIFDAEEYITDLGLQSSSARMFDIDTILIAMYGQGKTRGMTGLLKIKATTNQACCGISVSNEIITVNFLWIFLIGSYDAIRAEAAGSGQPNLNAELINSFHVTAPPLEEQADIYNFLLNFGTKIDSAIKKKEQLIDKLTEYKKSLIYEVVTGKREV